MDMKEEDTECKQCSMHCGSEGCCIGSHHGGKAHLFLMLGMIALVYGIINYFSVTNDWPSYLEWITGGIVLIGIGLMKKHYMMKKHEG